MVSGRQARRNPIPRNRIRHQIRATCLCQKPMKSTDSRDTIARSGHKVDLLAIGEPPIAGTIPARLDEFGRCIECLRAWVLEARPLRRRRVAGRVDSQEDRREQSARGETNCAPAMASAPSFSSLSASRDRPARSRNIGARAGSQPSGYGIGRLPAVLRGSPIAPAFYVMFGVAISLVAAFFLVDRAQNP
jgi:hypothetical protein